MRDADDARSGTVDWEAVERSTEFRELVDRRRRFVTGATVVFLAVFLTWLVLMAFAPDVMATEIADGVPLAWLGAILQVLLTWAVTWVYLRRADQEFEPLEHRAAERALSFVGDEDGTRSDGDAATASTAPIERSPR
jgi:uncharacterized membrane protein (DUF485 family)